MKPQLVAVEDLFGKAGGFKSGVNGQTCVDVLVGTILTALSPDSVAGADNILIIDDIHSTGDTAGAMLTRVRPSMATQFQVTVFCMPCVPLEEKNDEFDWDEALKKSFAEENHAGRFILRRLAQNRSTLGGRIDQPPHLAWPPPPRTSGARPLHFHAAVVGIGENASARVRIAATVRPHTPGGS